MYASQLKPWRTCHGIGATLKGRCDSVHLLVERPSVGVRGNLFGVVVNGGLSALHLKEEIRLRGIQ